MAETTLAVRVTVDAGDMDGLRRLIDRLEAAAKVRPDASSPLAGLAAVACVAAGSTRKFSRRALFGLGRKAFR